MSNWADKVDQIVAGFTRDLLGLARTADVDFDYAGGGEDKKQEVGRVMEINNDVVKALLEKKDG